MDELEIDVRHIMNHDFVNKELYDKHKGEKGPMGYVSFVLKEFEKAGHQIGGQFSFFKDPIALGELDFSELQKPGITNVTGKGNELDKISLKSNIWVAFKDKEQERDIVVIPIEFRFDFDAKIRRGARLKYGYT